MSISATDPFWSALASYDLGTKPTLGTTKEAAPNSASAASSSGAAGPSAVASTGSSATAGSAATTGSPSGSSTIAELLEGGTSGIAVAVKAAVDNSILDAML